MRRSILAATLAVAVLLSAGCGGSDDGGDRSGDAATPVASATGSAGGAGPAGGADTTRQVCADAKALGEEYKKKVGEILARAVQQPDETATEKVLAEVVPLSKEYKAKFESLAGTADNARLKDALTVLAKDMDNATPDTAAEATGAAEETLTGIGGAGGSYSSRWRR